MPDLNDAVLRLRAFLLIARGMANFYLPNLPKVWHVSCDAREGLEPHFRVLFSAIFQVLPGRISIRVETCGTGRKQKCGLLWRLYVQSFYVFC
jgi:hypothetical protein